MQFLKRVFNFFASYGFAVVILTLLLVLTFFGTLEQVEHGLYEVQKRYFESVIVVHDLFGVIPVPLPGVYLLLALLLVNLTCGAIIRAPKNWRRPGMLVAHFGIIFMIVSGFVTYHWSQSGHMTLYPRNSASHFASYFDWEISIRALGGDAPKEWIVPHEKFGQLQPNQTRVFHAAGLPFDLMIEGYRRNTIPVEAPAEAAGAGVDGIVLEDRPLEKEAEQNVAGAYATVLPREGTPQKGILWGFSRQPWLVNVGGVDYAIDVRHTQMPLPFSITLDEFKRELHPRTGMASNFESRVTKLEEGSATQVEIKMNEPLRHRGYTLFQAGWGPQDARPGDPLYSTFAVVKNPADQWPLYSCIIIAGGLLFHFLQRLLGYLRAENRRRLAT